MVIINMVALLLSLQQSVGPGPPDREGKANDDTHQPVDHHTPTRHEPRSRMEPVAPTTGLATPTDPLRAASHQPHHFAHENGGIAMASTSPSTEKVISHRRRRYLLYCLYIFSNPVRLPDIADQITIWENDGTVVAHCEKRLHTYEALYHDHLPVLEDAAVVEYSQTEDMVALMPAGEQLAKPLSEQYSTEITDLLSTETAQRNRMHG